MVFSQAGRRAVLAALVACAMVAPAAGRAAEVKVLASVAIKSMFDEVIPAFETASGDKVVIQYATAAGTAKQASSGEPFDVAVTVAAATDALVTSGVVLAQPRPVVGVAVAALAYREGSARPDISTEAKFRSVVLSAPKISLSDPALGGASAVYFLAVVKRLGLEAQIGPRLIDTKPGQGAAPVADGTARYGVAMTSEIAGVKGARGVPIFPADPASTLTLVASLSAKAAQPAAARAFIAWLQSPAAGKLRKQNGL